MNIEVHKAKNEIYPQNLCQTSNCQLKKDKVAWYKSRSVEKGKWYFTIWLKSLVRLDSLSITDTTPLSI